MYPSCMQVVADECARTPGCTGLNYLKLGIPGAAGYSSGFLKQIPSNVSSECYQLKPYSTLYLALGDGVLQGIGLRANNGSGQ